MLPRGMAQWRRRGTARRLRQQQEALAAPEGDACFVKGLDRAREHVELLHEHIAEAEDRIRALDAQGGALARIIDGIAGDKHKEGGQARREEDQRLERR